MSDKEMLKEADEWLYSMKCLLSVKTDEEDRAYTQKRIDLFNWLIEQAEQVQELELRYGFKESQKGMKDALYDDLKRKNKQLKNNLSVYKNYYNNTLKHNKELIERVQELEGKLDRIRFVNNDYDRQNKRYREAIDYVMTAEATQYRSLENALEDIKFVINETLESD